jgi:2-oxoglutarate dehydrogenase E1 component
LFDGLVERARKGKLSPADFQGTTISLTNPGTVGTMASSPRLMTGQGAIIAAGAIDYPAEYQGAAPETRSMLGIGKVMALSCTNDHRLIQGAESGMFLGKVQALLDGEDGFYEEIFAHLKMPHQPVRWETDRHATLPGVAGPTAEIAKEASVLQLINAYRVRGHLIADLDPLGGEPSYHPELDPVTYGLTIWDLDRQFLTGTLSEAIGGDGPKPVATLREILETLRQTYCAWSRRLITGRSTARRACASWSICSKPKSSSISCTPASWDRSASLWRAPKPPFQFSKSCSSAPPITTSTKW